MNNTTQYQLTTPAVSPNEINVTEIYGMHVLPSIENNWLSTIGEKGFIGWLQLLSMTLLQENLAKDGATVEYPTKKEILEKLGTSEKTFNRNILRPLFEVGLLDVVEDEQKSKLRKRGVPTSRIIVYRYPFNMRENLFKPLKIVRSFDTDYNSKAKLLGILGQRTKIENANEHIRIAQLESLIPNEPNEYEFVQDNVQNMGVYPKNLVQLDTENFKGGKNASFENVENFKGGENASFENIPNFEAGKNATFENSPNFEGGKSASFDQNKGGNFATNDNVAGLEHLSTPVDNSKVAEMQALDIYNNTNSFNNISFIFLEREIKKLYINSNGNDFEFEQIKNELIPKVRVIVEKLVEFNLPNNCIKDILSLLMDNLSAYGEAVVCDAAIKQLVYMYDQVVQGREINHFLALFKHGFEGFLVSQNFMTTVQSAVQPTIKVTSEAANASSGFYNWLDERE